MYCNPFVPSKLMHALQRHHTRYPVWGSLARDFLPVMASSVSSERAFSSAGITISKRRNRLRPDVIEALQFLKCMYRRDLLFHENPCAKVELEELHIEGGSDVQGNALNREDSGWDIMIEDLDNDEGFGDHDDNDVFVQTL